MSPAVTFLPLGAIIKSYTINGVNIVQSFPTTDLYQKHNSPFFGETIGRVANRIKDGKIDSLNGKSYDLVVNNGPNTLHGGVSILLTGLDHMTNETTEKWMGETDLEWSNTC